MSYQSRRILTPGASRKRKEREALYPTTSSKPLTPPATVSRAVSGSNSSTTSLMGAERQPISSNWLVAGYMAYEFLTNGTLFGQKFDPAKAEAVPATVAEPSGKSKPKPKPKPQSYVEVANLLKTEGAHVPDVVNPTELSRWIQM